MFLNEYQYQQLMLKLKEQNEEITNLRKIVSGLAERVFAQNELLSKKAEKK